MWLHRQVLLSGLLVKHCEQRTATCHSNMTGDDLWQVGNDGPSSTTQRHGQQRSKINRWELGYLGRHYPASIHLFAEEGLSTAKESLPSNFAVIRTRLQVNARFALRHSSRTLFFLFRYPFLPLTLPRIPTTTQSNRTPILLAIYGVHPHRSQARRAFSPPTSVDRFFAHSTRKLPLARADRSHDDDGPRLRS